MGFRRIEIPGITRQRTTTGAQLFDFDVWKGAECIRGTAVYSNNGMVLTATENDAYTDHTASAARIKVEPNTTYTFSWEHSGASGYVYIFSNGANVLASPVNTSKKSTFTTREDTTFISFSSWRKCQGCVASYSNIMLQHRRSRDPLGAILRSHAVALTRGWVTGVWKNVGGAE